MIRRRRKSHLLGVDVVGYRHVVVKARGICGVVAAAVFSSSLALVSPAQAEGLPVPADVTAALATFSQDPQGAVGAWAAWASSAPLTYVRNGKRPRTRSKCRIDNAGTADCDDFAQVIGRGNRNMGMKKISEIITAGGRQYFRDPPLKRWTKTRTASNPHPISGVESRIGFDPWSPWNEGAPGVTTQVLENGTMEVSASHPAPSEIEPSRTVVRISANGSNATLLEFDAQNRISNTTRITFQPVAPITIPKGR